MSTASAIRLGLPSAQAFALSAANFFGVTELADQVCVPCRGGVPPLDQGAIENLLERLAPGWRAVSEHHLEKSFDVRNFRQALAFTNEVGRIAEEQKHHPDIYLSWGHVRLEIWTHKINGLTESDFILAAKCEVAYNSFKAE